MTLPDRVLITGASSGIGLELARQFASHGHPLVITAPSEDELEEIAVDFRRSYEVSVRVVACDLGDERAPDYVHHTLAAEEIDIGILVNNAGFGVRAKFQELLLESAIEMIRLNIEASVRLTKLFLPGMLRRERGWILNTASSTAFEPGPLFAIYHATKAFVLSFSESLATELEPCGITVTALCPGPVDTDFFPKAGMVETRAFQKKSVMAPQDVAAAGFNALMHGDRVVVPGGRNKAAAFAHRILPEAAQAKLNQHAYEDVPPREHHREPGDITALAEARSYDHP